ncbi:ABC transporter [Slackia faecicanis]|uniref:ABC transporter n=1 Tax=Slackia faecicanis TaxID=255723 RepID=A0A3N0AGG5_9ACTN|nr:ATP-binding cassette domain-containing protein [Slackia faecicanis]MDO5359087.1 ATP-binding cassette domain-containing protein [Slackia faecicanis]RNL20912.1 ABC transporter [Slackia faecicanis]
MSLEVDIEKSMGGFRLEAAFAAGNETLGFLGASGCGKSLTLRCIAGIEKPDAGRIVVNGTTFFDKAPGRRAKVDLTPQQRKTALLFQNYMLFPNMTVRQNVMAGMDRGMQPESRDRIVEAQVRRFGLVGLEGRYPAQLSGGQQQRVALARMLAANPGILMLDEPFSALDAHLKSSLEQNLIGLFEEFEGTILYVSHDIDEAYRFCDRIAVVDAGHIDEIGPKDQVVHHPSSLAAVKLSGCKNTTSAVYAGEHEVRLPEWGVSVHAADQVPRDVKWFGVRAFMLRRASEPGVNVFRVRADRVSDSRFERTVMLSFLDAQGEAAAKDAAEEDSTMKFLKNHIQWRVDKLAASAGPLPEEGDEFLIEIPSRSMYLVTR